MYPNFILFMIVIITGIRKKALTTKVAVILVLIFYAVTKVSSLFIPDCIYLVASFPVTFLVNG
jgi:hypothetical protein